MKIFSQTVVVLLLFGLAIGLLAGAGNTADRFSQTAPDLLNATYWIAGRAVVLTDGRCETPAAPGSAMKTTTVVWGQPVFGDLNADGDQDAILVLVYNPGGSGTFYYVAAAINVNGRYLGTRAIRLGDRIAPMDIGIRNGMAEVRYTDRPPEAPMSTNPSVDKTAVLSLKNDQLFEVTSLEEKTTIFKGWVIIGHEVRSFQPCDRENVWWLLGQSPAMKAIMAAYRQVLPDAMNYRQLLMVLAGELVDPPADGFGADYDAAFLATRLVQVVTDANCTSQVGGFISSKRSGQKITFDLSNLDEAGLLGSPSGRRALSYEFCIPDTQKSRIEVKRIDPTVRFFTASPGRIGCGDHEILCIGSTHQQDFAGVLRRLASRTYVKRIDESFFE
jgi:hypothetical protein